MNATFGTIFSIHIRAEVLEYTRLAESIKAFVYGVSIPVKPSAKMTFQKSVQILLSYFSDKFVLLLNWIKTRLLGILFIFVALFHLFTFLDNIFSISFRI